MKQYNLNDEKFLYSIISVAYGDAGIIEKFRINLAARKDPRVKQLLDEYKLTADAVSEIPPSECPDYIIEKVEKETGTGERKVSSTRLRFTELFIGKPQFSAAIAIVVVGLIVSVLLINQPSRKPEYNKVQVELAEKQVKQSLALISRVLYSTGDKVENDIITQQVVKPVSKSLTIINNLFDGG